MLDRLVGPVPRDEVFPLSNLEYIERYDPPAITPQLLGAPSSRLHLASELWELSAKQSEVTLTWRLSSFYGRMAFRVAAGDGAPNKVLANWRWRLRLWTPEDRDSFAQTMARGWKAFLAHNPQYEDFLKVEKQNLRR
jgi:hypothetical protein